MVYSVISIGLYYPFWLLWQTRVANRLVPQKKISTPFIAACFILSFVNVLFLVPYIFSYSNPTLVYAEYIVENLDVVFFLIWLFKLRNRINEGMASRSGLYEWCSGLWTFLFGIFYLQYKINHLSRFIDGN